VTLNQVAEFVGLAVILIGSLATLVALLLAAVMLFPARPSFERKPPGRIVTDARDTGQNINLLVGVQSRGKSRWFFGLMTLASHDEAPRWPRVLTRKGDK
jgi:hypothetical protein